MPEQQPDALPREVQEQIEILARSKALYSQRLYANSDFGGTEYLMVLLSDAVAIAEAAYRLGLAQQAGEIARLRGELDAANQHVKIVQGERDAEYRRRQKAELSLGNICAEMAKHLSPENENVKRGYWVAALRDMAQIMVTSKDNARDAFGEIARLREALGLQEPSGS
jgi:hypothetical protein